MAQSRSEDDQRRNRTALIVFLAGVLLVLWAFGTLVYRTSIQRPEHIEHPEQSTRSPVESASASAGRVPPGLSSKNVKATSATAMMFLLALALLMLFIMGSYILIRGSRRYQQWVGQKRSSSTPSEDLWAIHRTPALDDEDDSARDSV